MFCVDLRTNSDYFPIQHLLTGLYNRDGECLLRGTDCVFVLPRITRLTQFEVSQTVTLHRVSRHLIGVLVTLLAFTNCFWCTQETRELIQILN